jgi:hypothetical protein
LRIRSRFCGAGRVQPGNLGKAAPILLAEAVGLGGQALVADDSGERKRHVYFAGGFQDQPDVLQAGIEGKPGLFVVPIGDAVYVFRHGRQKTFQHVGQGEETAAFLGQG